MSVWPLVAYSHLMDPETWSPEPPPLEKVVLPPAHPAHESHPLETIVDKLLDASLRANAPGGESPARVQPRQPNRRGQEMRPMAGERQKIIGAQFETVAFAKRRQKNRARSELAKASRKRNR